MKYNPGKNPPSSFLLAQDSHVAWGMAATFGSQSLGFPWYLGALVILIVALIKELTYDTYVEKQPFIWSGAIDWAFYCVGVGIAASILIII